MTEVKLPVKIQCDTLLPELGDMSALKTSDMSHSRAGALVASLGFYMRGGFRVTGERGFRVLQLWPTDVT